MTDARKLLSRAQTDTVDFSVDLNVEDFWSVQVMASLSAGTLVFNFDLFVPTAEGGTGNLYRVGTLTPDADGAVSLIAPGGGINAIPGKMLRITFDITTTATYSIDVVGR